MPPIRITVCELPDQASAFQRAIAGLERHVREQRTNVLFLPELAAHPWIAHRPRQSARVWDEAVVAHDSFVAGLSRFGTSIVVSTRPVAARGRRLNQGFVWDAEHGYRAVHDKTCFPDEPGWFEARWFDAGSARFKPIARAGLRMGFQICTEVMFNEWSRRYAKKDVDLIAAPRATPDSPRWEVALRMAAIASGAFVASSNRCAPLQESSPAEFGGRGLVIDPEGAILGSTSRKRPFVTVQIDPSVSEAAKATYPRNVRGNP